MQNSRISKRSLITKYYGLVNAIPKEWKANFKNPIPIVEHNTPASSIYTSLLKTIFISPTAETKILCHGFTKNTVHGHK